MKKKKFRMSVILCILTLLLCVGIPQYSAISVKAAISKTSNKQTGFVKEEIDRDLQMQELPTWQMNSTNI